MTRNLSIILLIILMSSCMTHSNRNNYAGYDQFKAGENCFYYFKNEKANSLFIYIDGSGLSSVLGVAEGNSFISYSFAYSLSEYYCDKDSILIPEKPGMSKGGVYHDNLDVVKLYTVDNLVNSYASSIDQHLSTNKYERIYIIGFSEGGLLVPKIYSELESKNEISGLIILGAGGLSQYECFKIQYESYMELPMEYREQLSDLAKRKEDIMNKPTSITDGYLGWPYSRWSSFFEYEPLEYITEITIPVLYLQGKEDNNSPIESVEAVEKLAKSNISFEYIDNMGHSPRNNKQLNHIFGLIDQWRSKN
jgi:pimeloyl-ACP methyl ester carboxylesterase